MAETFWSAIKKWHTNIATSQENDYTTGCLLDYVYFQKNYKLIDTDLSK